MKENQETLILEKKLGTILNPVAPQTDFVNELQERLRKKAQIVIERPNYMVLVLFIFCGLFIGVFIYWLFKSIKSILRKVG